MWSGIGRTIRIKPSKGSVSTTEAPVLKYYEPMEELTLQSDASQTGQGAVLTQNGQPLAFASRALSDTETRYAQIEKELLSVVFWVREIPSVHIWPKSYGTN